MYVWIVRGWKALMIPIDGREVMFWFGTDLPQRREQVKVTPRACKMRHTVVSWSHVGASWSLSARWSQRHLMGQGIFWTHTLFEVVRVMWKFCCCAGTFWIRREELPHRAGLIRGPAAMPNKAQLYFRSLIVTRAGVYVFECSFNLLLGIDHFIALPLAYLPGTLMKPSNVHFKF